jgi:4-amino-4-deoxy-L-arabinose transferase-like glycosyltransferase
LAINSHATNKSSLFNATRPAISRIDIVVYAILAAVLVFRLIYVSFLGLLPDEAYYWDWSRNPAFGYFDHPPMVAWLIALSRAVFGETVLGVRSLMCVCALVASVSSYLLVKKYAAKASSRILWALLSNCVLLFGVGSLLATPDIPFVLFWSLCLLAAHNAIFNSSTRWWLALGVGAGFGMLSKYTFVLFPVSLAVFLILSRDRRFWLARWQPWTAAGAGMLIGAPNIVWNGFHRWTSILFQFSHGVDMHAAFHMELLGEFIAGQIGVLSVLPFALLAGAAVLLLRTRDGSDRLSFLLTFLLVPFCFFLLASAQKKVEANWAACAYVSGFMLVAIVFEGLDGIKRTWFRRLAVFSVFFSAITTGIVLFHIQKPLLPLLPQNDPAVQARGWKTLAQEIDNERNRFDPRHLLSICTNRYQEAALFGFYLPDHPKTFTLNIASRDNQYSLWPERRPPSPAKVIFLHSTDDPNLSTLCEKSFSSYALWAKVLLDQGAGAKSTWGILTGTLR